jgi:signal transduction histidine kinase
LVIAVAFLCHDLWYKNLKDEHIGIIFYLSITALAFTSSFLVLASKFSQGSIIIFIIHIAMIGFLLSWKATLLVLTLGLYGAFKYYEYCFNGELLLSEIEEVKLKIIYILFIIFIFFITFFKNRQEVYELVEEKSHYLELKVIDQKNELVKLQEFKNELLQNIEHEMRTPITGITSLGQVLWDNYDKFNEEQRRNATRDIAQSSERLTSLVNNLIDLSKLRNLDYNLNKSEINLSELVLKRLEICQKLYMNEKNREDLNFEVEVEDKLTAFCDEHYITRTIDNIIINAIQYCPKGQITVKLNKNSGEEIEFSVKDEGIGIPEEELYEVFGAFIVSSRTKTPAGGRGIGLALCKKVIKAHNGEIWAKQNPDKGTIFTFTLPRNNKD